MSLSSPGRIRLRAFLLTVVLLFGGSGASALDLALYHLGGAPTERGSHRIAGTETPRPHGDTCALLDWTARGPYAIGLSPIPPRAAGVATHRTEALPLPAPRAALLFASARPRAPPLHQV